MHADARHRLVNLAHSVLLIAGMAATTWIGVSAVAPGWLSLAVMAGVVGAFLFAPQAPKEMLLRLYKARRLTPREFPDAFRMIDALTERAGLDKPPALYYIPSAAPNAFAIGRRDDSAIGVSDGLLRLMDRREFAGVLAHEVSHIANGDLWIMGLADAMSRITAILSTIGQILLLTSIVFVVLGEPVGPWWAPIVLILSPTVVSLLQLALSRTREFDADRGGAALTGDPLALASALAKLERRRGRFWEEIVFPGRRIPEPSLLRTHPPTEERIARLKEFAAAHRDARPIDLPPGYATPTTLRLVERRPRLHLSGLWW